MADDTPQKTKKRFVTPGAWDEAKKLVHAHRSRLILGLVLMLVSRLAGLVLPWMSGYVIDDVIGEGQADLLIPLALWAGAATLVQASSGFALSQVLGVAAQRAITEMRKRVQRHITRLPVSYFDSTKTGVLISRVMTDAEGIRNLVGTGLAQLVGGLVTATIGLGVLFYLNWRLTTVTLVILVLFGLVMATAFAKLRPLFRERGKINAEVTGRLGEMLGGVRIIKAYSVEKREQLVFAKGAHRLLRNVAKTVTGVSATTSAATLVIGGIGALIIVMGGRAIIADQWTVGDLLRYLLFTGVVVAPVVSIASIGTQITEAFAGLDRIREILGTPTEMDEDESRQTIDVLTGDVELEHVTFSYTEGMEVLRDVSLTAPAGTTTALVGSSGSGKSTLVSLVMAFNRPQKGRVLVDGRDLATLKLADYRRQLGVVLQENFLFDGSVASNISFARRHATRAEIEEVSRIAHCHEFIQEFPDGYDTIVGERGVKLSGGQRQRVAIARAILADPRLLILDEATSSLDSESEAMIQDGLRALRRGRTTFVIAHRLSTIQSADQILVLEHGQIVERGTHTELLAADGRYRVLYDTQYRFEQDRFINPGEDFTPELEKVVVPKSRTGSPTSL
ncbi:MAG: ABC transporter ATP-binding protein [Acidobacteria bacterium]|nr:MAG: ABC transporter ATP-binding protein [Acidobacteriota bacterium]